MSLKLKQGTKDFFQSLNKSDTEVRAQFLISSLIQTSCSFVDPSISLAYLVGNTTEDEMLILEFIFHNIKPAAFINRPEDENRQTIRKELANYSSFLVQVFLMLKNVPSETIEKSLDKFYP